MCCFRIGKFQATPTKQDPGAVRVQGFVSKFPTGSPSFSYGSSFPPEWVGGGGCSRAFRMRLEMYDLLSNFNYLDLKQLLQPSVKGLTS